MATPTPQVRQTLNDLTLPPTRGRLARSLRFRLPAPAAQGGGWGAAASGGLWVRSLSHGWR